MDNLKNYMLHGGDYNPEQWFDYPEILEKDIEMLKAAKINFVSLGIFSWYQLEPREGEYNLDWLEDIINKLYDNGISTILASPSASRPSWLANKYVETNRVNRDGQREVYGNRHNHCNSSPILKEKLTAINLKLSERFANHKAVIAWHISNEINGECLCPLCQNEFRLWLKEKYGTIENLNKRWWNSFWGHNFNSFDEINLPYNYGDLSCPNLSLDFNRFVTDNAIKFYKMEEDALKTYNKDLPATTNYCYGLGNNLNYPKFSQHLDFVSWDSYHEWHKGDDIATSLWASLNFDLMRSMKKEKPLFIMETTPATANWRDASKLKRPKMHMLASMQAISHGSNSIGYFQIRRSKGNAEMFHSAVIDNDNSMENRTYKDVKAVGETLNNLSELLDTTVSNKVAIYYDYENRDIININVGPRKGLGMKYNETVEEIYCELKKRNIGVDFVFPQDEDLCNYEVIILPMAFMLSAETIDRLKKAVENGTKLYSTFFSGYVDMDNLYYDNGQNSEFAKLHGITLKEFEALYVDDYNTTTISDKSYKTNHFAEIIEVTTAEVIGVYEQDFYAGTPCVTKNAYGKGCAYYLTTKFNAKDLVDCIFGDEIADVLVNRRENDEWIYNFVMNFGNDEVVYHIAGHDVLNNREVENITLGKYDFGIVKVKK